MTWLEIPSMDLRLAVKSWEWDRESVECDREVCDPVEYKPGDERYTVKLRKGADLGQLVANQPTKARACISALVYTGGRVEIVGSVRAIADDCITIDVLGSEAE